MGFNVNQVLRKSGPDFIGDEEGIRFIMVMGNLANSELMQERYMLPNSNLSLSFIKQIDWQLVIGNLHINNILLTLFFLEFMISSVAVYCFIGVC